jgi:hypothetical protein
MTSIYRKTALGALAALTFGAGIAASSAPATAGGGWAGPVAAGVIGGLALGAIAAGAANPYYGYGYGYGYDPGYYGYPAYGGCYLQRQPVADAWGNFAGYRRVRVCY